MNEGYIRLYRSMLEHLDMPGPALKVWLFLLLRARFRPAKGLAPGDVLTTYQEMIDVLSENPERPMARSTVAAALDYLEGQRMIRRHRKGRAGLALRVSVVNWGRYQGEAEPGEARPVRPEENACSPMLLDQRQVELQPTNQVNGGNPHQTSAAGDEKNDKQCLNDGEGRSQAAAAIHNLFIELTGKFPSGRDETLIEAAVRDVEDAGLESPGILLDSTMRKAAAAYKPTRLSPRPHDFRWFIGWIRRAIQDELARREVNRTDKTTRRAARKQPAGIAGSEPSKWVDPSSYDD